MSGIIRDIASADDSRLINGSSGASNGIVKNEVPEIVCLANLQGGMAALPELLERESLIDKYTILQKFYSVGKPQDLKIPDGSQLLVKRDTLGAEKASAITVVNEEYGFFWGIDRSAVAALLNAGFRVTGKFVKATLERKIMPDLSEAFYRYIEVEFYLKD